MREFSFNISGKNLEVNFIKRQLKTCTLFSERYRGESTYLSQNKIKKSYGPTPFIEDTLSYERDEEQLIKLLELLKRKEISVSRHGIEELAIHELIERNEGQQINHEMSNVEISLLSDLGAYLTWSVMLV